MTTIAVDLSELAAVESELTARGEELAALTSSIVTDAARAEELIASLRLPGAAAALADLHAALRSLNRDAPYGALTLGYLGRIVEVRAQTRSLREDLERASAADHRSWISTVVGNASALTATVAAAAVGLATRNPAVQASKWIATDLIAAPMLQGEARREGSRRQAGGVKNMAGYVQLIPAKAETVAITKVMNERGEPAYVVTVRGMALGTKGVNDHMNTLATVNGTKDPYSEAIIEAMRKEIPRGANVMMVGHSQGGAAVANIVGNDKINDGRYRITHAAFIGSPAQGKNIPSSTKVLRVENTCDPVPSLDGISLPDADIYKFSDPHGNPHDAKNYAREMASDDFTSSETYREFANGTDKYYSQKPVEVATYSLKVRVRGTDIEY